MLRSVNSQNCGGDIGGPTCIFNLTRLNKVDYSLTGVAQKQPTTTK